MELIMSQRQTYKMKGQFIFYISLISFLLSFVHIETTSLLFTLPFFYVCFMCGYQALLGYAIGLIIAQVLFVSSIESLYICLICFVLLEGLQFLHSTKSEYIPFILTLIAGIYYAYIQIDLLMTLTLTLLTYTNIIIFQYLPPLMIHQRTQLLTHQRLKALSIIVLLSIITLLPYSPIMTFILMRVYVLIMIDHDYMDDLLPALFYVSMYLLLIDTTLTNDILSLIIPLFFFYMFKATNKPQIISLYLISHITLPFFINFSYQYDGLIVVVSAFIYMIIPRFHKQVILSSSYKEISMKQQITKQVDSFCHLFEQMTTLFNETPHHNHSLEYVGYIYEDVCLHCQSVDTCFNAQYGPHRLVKLMRKGLSDDYNNEDLSFIKNYCLRPNQYLDKITHYKEDYSHIERIQEEYHTMKKDLYHQFSLLNDVFNQFSQQIQIGQIEDRHIEEHLKGYHFDIAYLKKYYESQSSYYIELGIFNTTKEEIHNELLIILQEYLNETLEIVSLKSPMHRLGYTSVILKHHSQYFVQYGLAQCSGDPLACGDSYTMFSLNEDQYFALSDGMGQGQNASDDSSLTLDVMKQLIMNGISLKDTIQSVNALLKIKNRNDMFTTLDMIQINLVSGKSQLIKYGSCPTYIIRDNDVIELSMHSLPIGIVSPLSIDSEYFQLLENDIIIMITDGYPHHFKRFLKENLYLLGDDHPKDMSHLLLKLLSDEGLNDDMTLFVLKLMKQ